MPPGPCPRRRTLRVPVDLVLDGLALLVTDGPTAAAPTLRHVVNAFASPGMSAGEGLRWGWFAQAAASALWDDDAWHAMLVRQVRLAREAGALDQLPIMLGALGTAAVWSGDFAAAASLIAEADAVCEATGSRAAPFAAMMLASLRGDQAEADPLIEATIAQAAAGGQGNAVAYAHWVAAILANGLGRYEGALAAARHASEDTFTLHVSMWALPELVEAAARTGNTEVAADALERLAETTQAGGTDFGLGLEARCRALLQRRGGRRRAVPRGDRPAGPHPVASGAGPRAPAVRGVAAPRGTARRRARAAAHGARHVRRDRHGGVRRARPPGADRHRGEGAASAAPRRATGSRRRRSRSPGWPATAAPARRSAPSCSCPRARSNGTWARYSPSSASAPAASCRPRWPARDSRTSRPSQRSQRPVACPVPLHRRMPVGRVRRARRCAAGRPGGIGWING